MLPAAYVTVNNYIVDSLYFESPYPNNNKNEPGQALPASGLSKIHATRARTELAIREIRKHVLYRIMSSLYLP